MLKDCLNQKFSLLAAATRRLQSHRKCCFFLDLSVMIVMNALVLIEYWGPSVLSCKKCWHSLGQKYFRQLNTTWKRELVAGDLCYCLVVSVYDFIST